MCGLQIHEAAQKSHTALIIGMGGGDFILGLPVIRYLKSLGVKKFYLGSLCVQWWSREGYIAIGPDVYSITSLSNVELVPPTAAILNDSSLLRTSLYEGEPPEPRIARLTDATPVEVSLEQGVEGLSEGLNNLVDKLGIDVLIAVDCGGDSLVSGKESIPPLTPLHDWAMAAALTKVRVFSYIGVGGYGCDGEVPIEELDSIMSELMQDEAIVGSYCLTLADSLLLEQAFKLHFDPVDELVMKAAKGKFGYFRILGFRIVKVTPLAAIIFFLDPIKVFKRSPARHLVGTRDVKSMETEIAKLGFTPETFFVHHLKLYK